MSFSILSISSAEQADMPAPMDVEAPELEHQEKAERAEGAEASELEHQEKSKSDSESGSEPGSGSGYGSGLGE